MQGWCCSSCRLCCSSLNRSRIVEDRHPENLFYGNQQLHNETEIPTPNNLVQKLIPFHLILDSTDSTDYYAHNHFGSNSCSLSTERTLYLVEHHSVSIQIMIKTKVVVRTMIQRLGNIKRSTHPHAPLHRHLLPCNTCQISLRESTGLCT
jgi:hypothetical protein